MMQASEWLFRAMDVDTGYALSNLILCKLANRANSRGEAWPSLSTLANECRCSRSSVVTHVNRLEKSGFLRRVHRFGEDGQKASTLYQIQSDKLLQPSKHSSPADELGSPADGLGSPADGLGVVQELDGGSAGAGHKTPIETPIIETIAPDSAKPQLALVNQLAPKESKPRKKKAFVPPTVEQIRSYAVERGEHGFDAEHFHEYYTLSGWIDGKGRKIKNWKQIVLGWIRRDTKARSSEKDQPTSTGDFYEYEAQA